MTSQNTETTSPSSSRNGAGPVPPHDLYTDPKIAGLNAGEDPILKFLLQYWKPLASTLVSILVVLYFYKSFQDSYVSSMQASADLIKRAQTEFQNYGRILDDIAKTEKADAKDGKQETSNKVQELKKQSEETKSRLEQLLTAAEDARDPYKKIAVIYRALISRKEGNSQAQALLEPYRSWATQGSAGSAERFYAELAALTLARADLDSPEQIIKGKQLLKELTLKGEFVAASALSTLSLTAVNAEEQKEAAELKAELLKNHPEFADSLKIEGE